jgi:hypothetical protein
MLESGDASRQAPCLALALRANHQRTRPISRRCLENLSRDTIQDEKLSVIHKGG